MERRLELADYTVELDRIRDALEQLDSLLPASSVISPLQLARMHGRERQRASGTRGRDDSGDEPEW